MPATEVAQTVHPGGDPGGSALSSRADSPSPGPGPPDSSPLSRKQRPALSGSPGQGPTRLSQPASPAAFVHTLHLAPAVACVVHLRGHVTGHPVHSGCARAQHAVDAQHLFAEWVRLPSPAPPGACPAWRLPGLELCPCCLGLSTADGRSLGRGCLAPRLRVAVTHPAVRETRGAAT